MMIYFIVVRLFTLIREREREADRVSGKLDWVMCDVCQVGYHWDCVGITRKPKTKFNCGCNKTYFTQGQALTLFLDI